MVTKSKTLTWGETDTVLEAIFLESTLIKKYQPYYNVDERDDKSSQYLVITDEPWPRIFLVRARDFDKQKEEGGLQYKTKKVFGPYIEIGLIKEALKMLRRLFPFRDKKSADPRHEEFYRSLERSPKGSDEPARLGYVKNIRYLSLFFDGKSKKVRAMLRAEMNRRARSLEFEKADEAKRLIYALDHMNDIALLKKNSREARENGTKEFRIEAYDIAHLSGTDVVGVMTVFFNGQADSSQYRKFKISEDRNDDLAALAEVLLRRLNHSEWQYPDLIVVDGNQNHIKVAESVLKARRIEVPVVAVTKDDRHKAREIIGKKEHIKGHEHEIIAVNAEAHRFAIRYHRSKRKILTVR